MQIKIVSERNIGKKRTRQPDDIIAIMTTASTLPKTRVPHKRKAVKVKPNSKQMNSLYWRLYSHVRYFNLPYKVRRENNDGFIYVARKGRTNEVAEGARG